MIPLVQRIELSLVRAMLGEVFPALRAAGFVLCSDKVVEIKFLVDGELDEEGAESIECILTEVIADFYDEVAIEKHVIRCDAPVPLPLGADWNLAYRRRE